MRGVIAPASWSKFKLPIPRQSANVPPSGINLFPPRRGEGEGNVSPKLRARDQDSKALYIAHYYRDNAIAGVQMDGSFRTISLLADIRRTKIKLEG